MTLRFRIPVLGCALLAAALLTAPAAPAQTSVNGDLAYHAYDAGQYDIYVRPADGGAPTNLTPDSPAYDTSPDWSPDGTKLVFTSNRTGWNEIYVMDADGSDVRQLTFGAHEEDESWGARFSPDGTKILYTFNPVMGSGGDSDLYVMDPDGSDRRNLTGRWETGLEYDDYGAHWSSDGSRIVFGAARPGNEGATWEIVTANADGSGQQRLLGNMDHQRWVEYPSFSPDDSKIVFMQAPPSGNEWDVWVMNADGSGQENVTQHPAGDDYPTWSADGRQIYFSSNRLGGPSSDLFVIDYPAPAERVVSASSTRLRARAASSVPAATRVLDNVGAPDFLGDGVAELARADRTASLTDTRITPRVLRTWPGMLVRWTNTGTTQHAVQASTLRLFASRMLSPGAWFDHRFAGAGTYLVKDRTTEQTHTVEVLVGARRLLSAPRTIRLIWGAEQLDDTLAYDLQVRKPGAAGFRGWRSTTAPGGDFFAGVAGTYEFRARLRRVGASMSLWSPVRVVEVP